MDFDMSLVNHSWR